MRFIAIVAIAALLAAPAATSAWSARAEHRHLGREKEGQTEKRKGRIHAGGAVEIAAANRA